MRFLVEKNSALLCFLDSFGIAVTVFSNSVITCIIIIIIIIIMIIIIIIFISSTSEEHTWIVQIQIQWQYRKHNSYIHIYTIISPLKTNGLHQSVGDRPLDIYRGASYNLNLLSEDPFYYIIYIYILIVCFLL